MVYCIFKFSSLGYLVIIFGVPIFRTVMVIVLLQRAHPDHIAPYEYFAHVYTVQACQERGSVVDNMLDCQSRGCKINPQFQSRGLKIDSLLLWSHLKRLN